MKKTALISILGKPNAGKSTLFNQIIGQKISIVTPKVQTTRAIIKGIFTKKDTQLVFLDTPGIFNPKKNLEKAMVRSAWSSMAGTDIISLIIDVANNSDFDDEFRKIVKFIAESNTHIIILLNKIDLMKPKLELTKEIDDLFPIEELRDLENYFEFPTEFSQKIEFLIEHFKNAKAMLISAKSNKNIHKYIKALSSLALPGEWHYEEEEITTAPMRYLSSEITREQLFLNLDEELPYNLTVETETWEQINENEVKIFQNIIVNKHSHKKIILGENGNKIKAISTKARIEISKALNIKAHLFLYVKVREDWDKKPIYYENIGLLFPKNN